MCLSLSLSLFLSFSISTSMDYNLECDTNRESLGFVYLLKAKDTFHRPGRRVTIPHCVTSALRTLSLSLSVAKWAKDSWHWLAMDRGRLLPLRTSSTLRYP